jgi:hypothetical protein
MFTPTMAVETRSSLLPAWDAAIAGGEQGRDAAGPRVTFLWPAHEADAVEP